MNILVTGSNGQLGSEIKDLALNYKKFNFFFKDLPELDICDIDQLEVFFTQNKINTVINCAAYTAVDKAEENEKTALLNILLESENEKEIFSYLNSLTEETSKITEIYSIKGLNKNNIKYQYYSKVAAGAAALCCYQTALALASNQKPNHIFISKYELFKSGHWPLIITKNYFNIF